MKIKTQDLSDNALDWVVAKIEGLTPTLHKNPYGSWVMLNLDGSYCCQWSVGGPIIEREGISVRRVRDGTWRADFAEAKLKPDGSAYAYLQHNGGTPLIAAMRCYVASRLGDEVDVPDELVEEEE
jgi:hypothetical protein